MNKRVFFFIFLFVAAASVYSGCKRDEPAFDLESSGYPDAVGQIVLGNCAVSGCHNEASSHAAAGLDLSSWTTMMQGSRDGAVVIPYAHEHSSLFMICNTYPDLGLMMEPTMPYNDDPLTRQQIITLRNWINSGAPSRNGTVAFSGHPARKKYYVTNQGCDVVAVIDQETGLIMRYIPVGADFAIESPHGIRMSPDGEYWYVCFSSGRYLEKYRTSDDAFVGRILLGPNASAAFGSWNTFAITPDSRHAFVVDWSLNGKIAWVDLEAMTCNQVYQSSIIVQPHGSAVSPDGNLLYVTTTTGNFIYKFDITDPTSPQLEQVVIDGVSSTPSSVSSENGHEIAFSPDGAKYFITCSGTNVVRVFDPVNDALMATIPVGIYPQEMAFSLSTPYAYVTCTEDTGTFANKRGSVSVINWQTNSFVTALYTGHQPHGVAVDDDKQLVFIANRNAVPGGPAPHHSSACGGRNGYLSIIDMASQTVDESREMELSVDPYSCLYRP